MTRDEMRDLVLRDAADRLNAAADVLGLAPGYWLTAQDLRGLAVAMRLATDSEHLVAAAEALVGGAG